MAGLYPRAVADFRAYVDKYKISVDWPNVFNSNSDYQDYNGKNAPAPKFHEIPYLLQVGVILAWVYDLYEYSSVVTFPDPNDLLIDGVNFDKFKRNLEFMLRFIDGIRLPNEKG